MENKASNITGEVSQMNLGSGDVGNNNTITIQQNTPETSTETMIKYEDSNSDLITILKLQTQHLYKQLDTKDKQINTLLEIIKSK